MGHTHNRDWRSERVVGGANGEFGGISQSKSARSRVIEVVLPKHNHKFS